jgi:UDP-N-acetylmuramate--alanine ligase
MKATASDISPFPVSPQRAHFIGIGGIGMSGLAGALLALGWRISGSDMTDSEMLAHLRGLGATIALGHHGQNLPAVDWVIISDAISPDNPELLAAKAQGIPVLRRSQLLGKITAPRRTIAVAGTHGKTTTSSMLAAILQAAGLAPGFFLGGEYPPLGGNARLGEGDWVVVEACEAFSSFLDLLPEIGLITNIEPEHLDFHGSETALYQAFLQFLQQIKPGGGAVVSLETPLPLQLARQAGVKNIAGFALEKVGEKLPGEKIYQAAELRGWGLGSEFAVLRGDRFWARLTLQVPGRHNIANALAAAAGADQIGVSREVIAAALAEFSGVKRRFQIISRAGGITIVDDYAHHPTELAAVLAAVRQHFSGRLLAIFQPHLYSRTKYFADDFARVLALADLAWVTDIYQAREAPIPGVSGEQIAALAKKKYAGKVEYYPFNDLVAAVLPQMKTGDLVITLGAGNVDHIARGLAAAVSASAG